MANRLPPLVRWPGGKYHQAPDIVPLLPKHDTYVEPFAGGASVFWNKPPARTEVLGDANSWLMGFYRSTRDGGLRGCEAPTQSREAFDRARMCAGSNNVPVTSETVCCAFGLNRLSYHGNLKTMETASPSGKTIGSSVLTNVPQYEQRLANTKLITGDFEKTMRQHDSPSTVHYLDPPWVARDSNAVRYSNDLYHGHSDLSADRVGKVAASMRGKVLISYEDSPQARAAFQRAGLNVYLLPVHQSRPGQGTVKRNTILATNFVLAPSRK